MSTYISSRVDHHLGDQWHWHCSWRNAGKWHFPDQFALIRKIYEIKVTIEIILKLVKPTSLLQEGAAPLFGRGEEKGEAWLRVEDVQTTELPPDQKLGQGDGGVVAPDSGSQVNGVQTHLCHFRNIIKPKFIDKYILHMTSCWLATTDIPLTVLFKSSIMTTIFNESES